MNTTTPADLELHARATAHAFRHNVDYSEALQRLAQGGGGPTLPPRGCRVSDLDDAQIHAYASAYAARHQLSYIEALNHVVSFAEIDAPAPSAVIAQAAAPGAPAHQKSDEQIDAEARSFAAQNGVDYVSALQAIARAGAAAALEPADAGFDGVSDSDRRIDAAEQAQSRTTGADYCDSLAYVLTRWDSSFAEAGASGGDAVSALQGQYIEIFRAGTHTDSSGQRATFTAQDLQAIAAAYDPTVREAPLTLGHPDTDWPNYGRVKGLRATEDGRLLMLADRIDPAFADSVKAGRYRKRSASFYPPLSPNNPAPGKWYLRHVGWLGAQPPAVAGLADVKFSLAAGDGAICFDAC